MTAELGAKRAGPPRCRERGQSPAASAPSLFGIDSAFIRYFCGPGFRMDMRKPGLFGLPPTPCVAAAAPGRPSVVPILAYACAIPARDATESGRTDLDRDQRLPAALRRGV